LKSNMNLVPMPSQTVGPYFQIGLSGNRAIARIAAPGVTGERIKLTCTVFDGEGKTFGDAMIEIWQANAEGKYNHPDDTQAKPVDPAFVGFGRLVTNAEGKCAFETIKPGRVPGPSNNLQAPHLSVSVFARGLLRRLPTRVYFAGDPTNEHDPILALVPEERRNTLMAQPIPGERDAWRFDIHLCGQHETVFFDV
jgi:protocatechuate 3,4-dioxygenase, alpha subunit